MREAKVWYLGRNYPQSQKAGVIQGVFVLDI
jgi:hypothetical protein